MQIDEYTAALPTHIQKAAYNAGEKAGAIADDASMINATSVRAKAEQQSYDEWLKEHNAEFVAKKKEIGERFKEAEANGDIEAKNKLIEELKALDQWSKKTIRDKKAQIGKAVGGVVEYGGEKVGGAGKKSIGTDAAIDGIKIINGKVAGKIPINEFIALRKFSIKNPDANSMTLGKFTRGPDSYIAKAGTDSTYFDMGDEWGAVQKKYELTDAEMFKYFNRPALDDAISSGKTIRFSYDPRAQDKGFLVDEWEYIKETLSLADSNLTKRGDFWYVQ